MISLPKVHKERASGGYGANTVFEVELRNEGER